MVSGKDKIKIILDDFLLVDYVGVFVLEIELCFLVEIILYIYIYNNMNVGCVFYVYIIDNNVIINLYSDVVIF